MYLKIQSGSEKDQVGGPEAYFNFVWPYPLIKYLQYYNKILCEYCIRVLSVHKYMTEQVCTQIGP